MGGGASKNRGNKKIIPQFTVTIVINNEAIVAIDVCEDATLADARKEILLEAHFLDARGAMGHENHFGTHRTFRVDH